MEGLIDTAPRTQSSAVPPVRVHAIVTFGAAPGLVLAPPVIPSQVPGGVPCCSERFQRWVCEALAATTRPSSTPRRSKTTSPTAEATAFRDGAVELPVMEVYVLKVVAPWATPVNVMAPATTASIASMLVKLTRTVPAPLGGFFK